MSPDPVLTDLLAVKGIKLGTSCANIKHAKRRDLVIIELSADTHCVAVFTQNSYCAAPVQIAKQHIHQIPPRYCLINTGNANAGTGQSGLDNALNCCQRLAELGQCNKNQVLPFSTGVIGEDLQMDKMFAGIPDALSKLSENGWNDAAYGIMTTDTVAKGGSRQITIDGEIITLTAIAKGSGMIRPDMATMLAYIATDAKISSPLLQQCLQQAVAISFNRITVDGDTSTNDACVLIATGRAGNKQLDSDSVNAAVFIAELNALCLHLAQAIVRDAEGATKFVTVSVAQAESKAEAKKVAYTIAHSPLVKTALFASDPNWGRILAAVGRAGIDQLDISGVNIFLGGVCIVRNGGIDSDYIEEKGQIVMNRHEITITVELSRGDVSATIWTSDLSHEYVRINSEYRS